MDTLERIEPGLERALRNMTTGAPPLLAEALHYAVFPGGGRVRPRLALEVAIACGDRSPDLADGFATALEMIHCASLVHDDLPCFDDAETRRGRPALHRVFGEEIAVLAGDALIVHAFEVLASASLGRSLRLPELLALLVRAVGASRGIIAGQAWESEPSIDLDLYHRTKTASLFEAATAGGAMAAGHDGETWRRMGRLVGHAYQIADDIADASGSARDLGKPVGQDRANGRPSVVEEIGLPASVRKLDAIVVEAVRAIPPGVNDGRLADIVASLAERLCPPAVRRRLFDSETELRAEDRALRRPLLTGTD